MEGIFGLTYPLGINQEASKLPSSFRLVMWAGAPSDAQRQHLVQTSAVAPTALRHVQLGFFSFPRSGEPAQGQQRLNPFTLPGIWSDFTAWCWVPFNKYMLEKGMKARLKSSPLLPGRCHLQRHNGDHCAVNKAATYKRHSKSRPLPLSHACQSPRNLATCTSWHGRGWKWDSYAAPCVWQLLPKAYGWPLSYGNSTSHRGKEWEQDHGNPILLTSIILCLRWTPKLGLIFCGSSLCQCEPSPFSQYARHLHNSKQHHSPLQQNCSGERETQDSRADDAQMTAAGALWQSL